MKSLTTIAVVAVLALSGTAFAADTFQEITAEGGKYYWDVPANWVDGSVPLSNTSVRLTSSGSVAATVRAGTSQSCWALYVDDTTGLAELEVEPTATLTIDVANVAEESSPTYLRPTTNFEVGTKAGLVNNSGTINAVGTTRVSDGSVMNLLDGSLLTITKGNQPAYSYAKLGIGVATANNNLDAPGIVRISGSGTLTQAHTSQGELNITSNAARSQLILQDTATINNADLVDIGNGQLEMDGGGLSINFNNFMTEYYSLTKDPTPGNIILTGSDVSTINCSNAATLGLGSIVDASGVTTAGPYDLIIAAGGITDNGVVLDAASIARGDTLNVVGSKLVLTVAPEPATMVLFGLGSLGMLLRRKRR